MREATFQQEIVRGLRAAFEGCLVIKNDPELQQGFPDLLVLHKNKWAALEVKVERDAPRQPNQDYYIDLLDGMSFGAFIFPENKDVIFKELNKHFSARR